MRDEVDRRKDEEHGRGGRGVGPIRSAPDDDAHAVSDDRTGKEKSNRQLLSAGGGGDGQPANYARKAQRQEESLGGRPQPEIVGQAQGQDQETEQAEFR